MLSLIVGGEAVVVVVAFVIAATVKCSSSFTLPLILWIDVCVLFNL